MVGTPVLINGTLNRTSKRTLHIGFFTNAQADPSGDGEGQQFIGSASVITDARFSVALPPSVPAGQFITATATEPEGNTSELSAQLQPVEQKGKGM